MQIAVRDIEAGDPIALFEAFTGTPLARELSFFEHLRTMHGEGERVVLIGLADGEVVGHGSLVWSSDYPPFRSQRIPEINDLNVVPTARRRGVASRILDEAERRAAERSTVVGIGFGLHPGYRVAQRLYVRRGYVPDGNGVFGGGRFPQEGEFVKFDDDLALYLIKELSGPHR